jgi:hypothetical protein
MASCSLKIPEGAGRRFGKVGDGSSIWQNIEREERGVWRKSATGIDRASQECVQNLFGAQHWIFGEQVPVDRGEGTSSSLKQK